MTERTFSMRAGLAASTVTPGMTAPDVSLTTPAIEAPSVVCAHAAVGNAARTIDKRTTKRLIIWDAFTGSYLPFERYRYGLTWKMATLTAPWPSTEKYRVRRISIILTSQTRLELSVLSRIIGAYLAGGKYFGCGSFRTK